MKKIIAILTSLCMAGTLMLTGCVTNNNANNDETLNILSLASSTVDAYVESIDGNTLSLSIVTESETGAGQMGGFGDFGGSGDFGGGQSGQTPPTMPSDGSTGSGQTPPDMPTDGSAGQTGQISDNTPPADDSTSEDTESPGTTIMQNDDATMPGGGTATGSSTFVKSGICATLLIIDESVIYSSKDGEATAVAYADIVVGSIIEIVIDENSNITSVTIIDAELASSDGTASGGSAGGGSAGGGSSAPSQYTSVSTYDADTTIEGDTCTSAGSDENAILVTNGATVLFKDIILSRISSDSTGGDSASFYGVGAGLLVIDGTALISGGTFETDSSGGAGVFAYGTGKVYIAGATIATQQDTSGGVHVAGGGTLYAWDLTVTTEGNSSAAIRSDRGGGTMVLSGGSYTSNGTGSPAVYCTANIAVNEATLTANGSEAVCIEGLNSLYLFNTDLYGNMNDDSQNDTTWTVIVYQSMSGDSEVGNSTFQMVGGTLTSNNGGLIYTTNTESHILLSSVTIEQAADCEFLLQCTGNANQRGWGSTGSNGADCTFTAVDQLMNGDVIWDSISQLDFYMTSGSSLVGAITDDETWAGEGGSGYCSVYISSDSIWTITGDSTVTNLYNEGTISDEDGNTVTIIGTDGTVYVQGTSEYTITVSAYGTSADFSGMDEAETFSTFEVEMPSTLK